MFKRDNFGNFLAKTKNGTNCYVVEVEGHSVLLKTLGDENHKFSVLTDFLYLYINGSSEIMLLSDAIKNGYIEILDSGHLNEKLLVTTSLSYRSSTDCFCYKVSIKDTNREFRVLFVNKVFSKVEYNIPTPYSENDWHILSKVSELIEDARSKLWLKKE